MPVKILMSWEPQNRRWWKVVFGKRYVVSCRQLKKLGYLDIVSPDTKEHSRDAANRWLLDQLRGGQPSHKPTRFDDIILEMEKRKAWLASKGQDTSGYEQGIEFIRDMATDDVHESIAREFISPMQETWQERLREFDPPSKDKTVGFFLDKFLSLRKAEYKAGNLSLAAYEQCKLCLLAFGKWLNPGASVETINSQKWEDWYKWILATDASAEYKKKRLSYARSWCLWLVEHGHLQSFSSLMSRRYRFASDREEVQPLSIATVQEIVGKAKGVLKLLLLLMLNTGMTQKDISDLKQSEYANGRITRSRSKTKRRGTRVVSWKLWDSTRKLLDQYRQPTGDRLLLTSKGTTWVGEARRDGVNSLYRHLGYDVPLKRFRQTSGDFIKKKYGKELADHFLGHGQRAVDAAYFSRDQQELDDAVSWLGSHLFTPVAGVTPRPS